MAVVLVAVLVLTTDDPTTVLGVVGVCTLGREKRLGLLKVLAEGTDARATVARAVLGIVGIYVLGRDKQLALLRVLADGAGMRAAARIVDVDRASVARFLRSFAQRCVWLHHARVRNLACPEIQLDEQHSFVLVKQGHLEPRHPPEAGTTWTWTAIDRRTRLVLSFHVGKHTEEDATALLTDVRARVSMLPQFSSDGLPTYAAVIDRLFGPDVAYVSIVKAWDRGRRRAGIARSSGRPLLVKTPILGEPELRTATTAHNERINLTMRQHNARMHRRTLAFSKSLRNHVAAAAIHYVAYNFCNVLRTTKTTPAVAAGIAEQPWPLDVLLDNVLATEACEPPTPFAELRPRIREPRGRGEDARWADHVEPEPKGQLDLFAWRLPTMLLLLVRVLQAVASAASEGQFARLRASLTMYAWIAF